MGRGESLRDRAASALTNLECALADLPRLGHANAASYPWRLFKTILERNKDRP